MDTPSFTANGLGRDTQVTHRQSLWVRGSAVLWCYRALGHQRELPIFIVYSFVNRPSLLDISPQRSLIRALIEQGRDVYLLDWGVPTQHDSQRHLAEYVVGYLDDAISAALADAGLKRIDLLGVCQGGTLVLCYAALHPRRIRRLVLMVTPVDFATDSDRLARYAVAMDLSKMRAGGGNVSGRWLKLGFQALKPFGSRLNGLLAMQDARNDDSLLEHHRCTARWVADSPDQPGLAFEEFITLFYKENRLAAGSLVMDGRAVDLAQLRMPVLNIYALQDHLIPIESSMALGSLVSSHLYQSMEVNTGHMGVFTARQAHLTVPARIQLFLSS